MSNRYTINRHGLRARAAPPQARRSGARAQTTSVSSSAPGAAIIRAC